LKIRTFIFLLIIALFSTLFAQGDRSSWKRKAYAKTDVQLFHSIHVINLPTAETLQKKDMQFDISHRFIPPITEGSDAAFGIDGPVNMRLALAYAITDRLLVTAGRTNVNDNMDVQLKYKTLKIQHRTFPVLITLMGGAAYNSQLFQAVKSESRKYQYYGQLIANTLIHKKLGIGIVPSYLHNSYIFCCENQHSFVLGNYIQYYFSPYWSLQAEWNPTVTGWRRWHNTMSFGIELETGGHFFKIFLSNNDLINTAQYLSGADINADSGDWRFGFLITRALKIVR